MCTSDAADSCFAFSDSYILKSFGRCSELRAGTFAADSAAVTGGFLAAAAVTAAAAAAATPTPAAVRQEPSKKLEKTLSLYLPRALRVQKAAEPVCQSLRGKPHSINGFDVKL